MDKVAGGGSDCDDDQASMGTPTARLDAFLDRELSFEGQVGSGTEKTSFAATECKKDGASNGPQGSKYWAERVVGMKTKQNGQTFVRVKWCGWKDCTWERLDSFDCPKLVRFYLRETKKRKLERLDGEQPKPLVVLASRTYLSHVNVHSRKFSNEMPLGSVAVWQGFTCIPRSFASCRCRWR
jgi:hypothetical protein